MSEAGKLVNTYIFLDVFSDTSRGIAIARACTVDEAVQNVVDEYRRALRQQRFYNEMFAHTGDLQNYDHINNTNNNNHNNNKNNNNNNNNSNADSCITPMTHPNVLLDRIDFLLFGGSPCATAEQRSTTLYYHLSTLSLDQLQQEITKLAQRHHQMPLDSQQLQELHGWLQQWRQQSQRRHLTLHDSQSSSNLITKPYCCYSYIGGSNLSTRCTSASMYTSSNQWLDLATKLYSAEVICLPATDPLAQFALINAGAA
jgi:hypothetical protein